MKKLSYKTAGVDIDAASATKQMMGESLRTTDKRVLNSIGAFASLVDGSFSGYKEPVLALKTEEPGSKQKLAFKYGHISSICYDLINHLINDIIVIGAEPFYVQDCIICGKIGPDVVKELVASIAEACREQGCALVGGELSEQPGVVEPGIYVLSASIVGVVEKSQILDGSRISEGDAVLAVASNGLHTNGYSLVRALIDQSAKVLKADVAGKSFIDAIMEPHMCYWQMFKDIMKLPDVHGLAHITGGGIQGNLDRILPEALSAAIDLSAIQILPIFNTIHNMANIEDSDMLQTFNMGVGMTVVAKKSAVESIQKHLLKHECQSYIIGEIVKGHKEVSFSGQLSW